MHFLRDLARELRGLRKSGLTQDGPAPPDVVRALTAWLDDSARGDVATLRRLAGPNADQETFDDDAGISIDDWRLAAFEAATETLAGSLNLQPSAPVLSDAFRSWESVVLVREGYSFIEANAITSALPSFVRVRRMANRSPARALGVGLVSFAGSLRDRVRVGVLSLDSVMKVIRDVRLLTMLGAAIDADGNALEGFGPVVGNPIAQSVCTLSQLLADIRGAYEAAKGL